MKAAFFLYTATGTFDTRQWLLTLVSMNSANDFEKRNTQLTSGLLHLMWHEFASQVPITDFWSQNQHFPWRCSQTNLHIAIAK